jgi:hypothetical protein
MSGDLYGNAREDNALGKLVARVDELEQQVRALGGGMPTDDWGAVEIVTKTSHGFSAWDAVAADDEGASDWVKADPTALADYIRRGVVSLVIDANTALILTGRGWLPYDVTRTLGERLYLDSSTAGLLISTHANDEEPWLDLSMDSTRIGTVLPVRDDDSAAGGVTLTVTKSSHGWSAGYLVLSADPAQLNWYAVDAGAVALGEEIWRGVVLRVIDSDSAEILIEGKGTVSGSPSWDTWTTYGAVDGTSVPDKQSGHEYFEPWFVSLGTAGQIYLLPRAGSAVRRLYYEPLLLSWSSGGSDTEETDDIYFRLAGGTTFVIEFEAKQGINWEDRYVAGLLFGRIRAWDEDNDWVEIDTFGVGSYISIEDKTVSGGGGGTYEQHRGGDRAIGVDQVPVPNGSWTDVSLAAYANKAAGTGTGTLSIKIEAQSYTDGDGVPYLRFRINASGTGTTSGEGSAKVLAEY